MAALRDDAEVVLGASPVLALPPVRDPGLALRLLGPVLHDLGGGIGGAERGGRHGEESDRQQRDRRGERDDERIMAVSVSTPALCYGKNLMADVRIDKWLWAARFFKSRTLAAAACAGGKIDVNGDAAKPSKSVRPGDLLQITLPRSRRIVRVAALAERRGSGSEAALLYEDLTPPPRRASRGPRRPPSVRPGPAGPPSASGGTSIASPAGRGAARGSPCLCPVALLRSLRHRCPGGPPGAGPREGGVNPPRPRHCNRVRNPRSATDPARAGSGRRGE